MAQMGSAELLASQTRRSRSHHHQLMATMTPPRPFLPCAHILQPRTFSPSRTASCWPTSKHLVCRMRADYCQGLHGGCHAMTQSQNSSLPKVGKQKGGPALESRQWAARIHGSAFCLAPSQSVIVQADTLCSQDIFLSLFYPSLASLPALRGFARRSLTRIPSPWPIRIWISLVCTT